MATNIVLGGQCLFMICVVVLDLKDFGFACSPPTYPDFLSLRVSILRLSILRVSIPKGETFRRVGEYPFNVTWLINMFPWKQESELATVVVLNSKQLSHFIWNTHCGTLFLPPFSPIFFSLISLVFCGFSLICKSVFLY